MKLIDGFLLSCVVALCLVSSAFAGSFEGIIYTTTKGAMKSADATKGMPLESKTYVKGSKIRMEGIVPHEPGKAGAGPRGFIMIIDNDAKKMITLMPSQNAAYISGLSAEPGERDQQKRRTTVRTGKTEIIAGYKAEQFVVKDEDGDTSEFWGAKIGISALDLWAHVPSEELASFSSFEKTLAREYYPMRMVTYEQSGKPDISWEVTKVEKQSLSSDLFTVPAGYKTVDQAAMQQQQQMQMTEQMKAQRDQMNAKQERKKKSKDAQGQTKGAPGNASGGPQSAEDMEKMLREMFGGKGQ
ncbi:MAG: DUF4412 domain-containing protein [Nitrospiraceae bacterium]